MKILLAILKLIGINKIGHSYHDVVVYVDGNAYDIFNLPYGYELSMNRVAGWGLYYRSNSNNKWQEIGGEYTCIPFRIEVNGIVICDYKKCEQ